MSTPRRESWEGDVSVFQQFCEGGGEGGGGQVEEFFLEVGLMGKEGGVSFWMGCSRFLEIAI